MIRIRNQNTGRETPLPVFFLSFGDQLSWFSSSFRTAVFRTILFAAS